MCLEVSGDVQRRKAKPAIQYGMKYSFKFFSACDCNGNGFCSIHGTIPARHIPKYL